MTDARALADDHVLKPLETRMLEMCDNMGPLMVAGGNFVAALRVFAAHHPGLVDECLPASTATTSRDEDTVLATMQYLGFDENGLEAEVWLGDSFSCHAPAADEIDILTTGGTMIASKGDWLVKDTAGEIRIVKPESNKCVRHE